VNVDKGSRCEIWGEVVAPGYSDQDALEVLLIGKEAKPIQRTTVTHGNYDFRSVPAGWYQFDVVDRAGNILAIQTQALKGTRDHVGLLVARPGSGNGTVSLSNWRHSVPRRARQAFEAATKAGAVGNLKKQLELLNTAVAIDPDFAEAHDVLTLLYRRTGDLIESEKHARIAFDLNPGILAAGPNLAVLLIGRKDYAAAEVVARQALKSQPDAPSLGRILAMSLIEQRRNIDEGLAYVRNAATEFPSARLFAAKAFADIGRFDLAVMQVKEVLRSQAEHPCEQAALENWVAAAAQRQATQDKLIPDIQARPGHCGE
jgi:tetratricopeptide (TPR) repeat protein